jgi:hypothetical protein
VGEIRWGPESHSARDTGAGTGRVLNRRPTVPVSPEVSQLAHPNNQKQSDEVVSRGRRLGRDPARPEKPPTASGPTDYRSNTPQQTNEEIRQRIDGGIVETGYGVLQTGGEITGGKIRLSGGE